MSILIKGMKMPKGRRGIFACVCPDSTAIIQDDEVIQTTAIELPPHGRLIDADALMNNIVNRIYIRIATGETNPADWCITGDVIAKAPTIIEAEDGE